MNLRQLQIAQFFAPHISSNEICQTLYIQNETIDFKLIPNPGTYELTVTVNDGLPFEIILYNLEGQPIITSEGTNPIRVDSLEAGLYLVELKRQNQRFGLVRYLKQ